jgi:hypothetical protein
VEVVQIPAGKSATFDIGGVGVSLVLIKDGDEKSVPYESPFYTVSLTKLTTEPCQPQRSDICLRSLPIGVENPADHYQ